MDYVWLSTCRSAIGMVLDEIPFGEKIDPTALVPAYTCETVLEPFITRDLKLTYYETDLELRSTAEEIIKRLEETHASIFLFHHYFGFKTISDVDTVIEYSREHGITTIEDRTQSMYSGWQPSEADYHVGSIRKWHGVPDGAYLLSRVGRIEGKPTEYDRPLEEAMVEASMRKYRYMIEDKGEKHDFLDQYGKAKEILDSREKAYSISPVSQSLQSHLNISAMAERRRENYRALLESTCWTEDIHPTLSVEPTNETPLYFSLWVDDRASLQKYLAGHSIYAPIIWPKPEVCPIFSDDIENLYSHMLCIPIDQRYGSEEMNYITQIITKYVEQH